MWINERGDLYHLAGDGYANRLDWAKLVLEIGPNRDQQNSGDLLPGKTSDYPTPTRGPLTSALNYDRFNDTFSLRLSDWQEALKLAVE